MIFSLLFTRVLKIKEALTFLVIGYINTLVSEYDLC
jgi:hypothetical protein